MNPEIVGFAAGTLTSINLIPQIIKSVKTKQTEDISLVMYLIYDLGLFLWVVYGFLLKSYAIIFMDGTALLSSLIMTYIKLKYRKHHYQISM